MSAVHAWDHAIARDGHTSRLHPEDVEAIARRVAELLSVAPAAPELIDAHEAGRRLGRSAVWVRRHAAELGAVPLGDGDRPRLGFPPERIAGYVAARSASNGSLEAEVAAQRARPRRRRGDGSGTGTGAVPFDGPGVPPWR